MGNETLPDEPMQAISIKRYMSRHGRNPSKETTVGIARTVVCRDAYRSMRDGSIQR